MRRFGWMVFLALFLVALATAQTTFAQDNPPPKVVSDDEVNQVAKGLYCPVCENIPLDVCPTQACTQWRELIREKLSQGWTDAQIKQYFVDQYGDRVLATPPARGLNWLVYIIPPLAILAGVVILYQAFKAWRKPSTTPVSAAPAQASIGATSSLGQQDEDQEVYVKRIENELKKL